MDQLLKTDRPNALALRCKSLTLDAPAKVALFAHRRRSRSRKQAPSPRERLLLSTSYLLRSALGQYPLASLANIPFVPISHCSSPISHQSYLLFFSLHLALTDASVLVHVCCDDLQRVVHPRYAHWNWSGNAPPYSPQLPSE